MYMKQFLMMLAFLSSLWVGGQAREVSPEQARQKAFAFLKTNKRVADGAGFAGRSVKDVQLCYTSAGKEAAAFYVFNAGPGGFVVVSAEDRTEEILGYSTNGRFDEGNLPDGLRELLQDYARQIAAIGAQPEPQTRAVSRAAAFSGTKVIETAQWDQGWPYNMYCPGDCPTGCVATAMAIVMKHHGYPATGRGSHSYQVPGTGETLSADFSSRTYDWASMPMQDAADGADADYLGVARLMADVGIATEMNYAIGASGASLFGARQALVENFIYSSRANVYTADVFTAEQWSEMLREEIDNNRPVIYCGTSDRDNGHAFVVDGYSDNRFSINWGWGGSYKGFFMLGLFQPNENHGNYHINQGALLHVMPSDGTEDIVSPLIYHPDSFGFCGITTNCSDVKKGETYSIITGRIANFANNTFVGTLYAGLFDRNGQLKSLISEGRELNLDRGRGYSKLVITCNPSVDAADGDYVALVTQASGSDEYRYVCDRELNIRKLPATRHTPKTATVTFEHKEGVSISLRGEPWNFLYQGKPVVGSSFYFEVKAPENVVKTIARYNSVAVPYSPELDVYMIERLTGDETVNVKTYAEADLIPTMKVHADEAGTIENMLGNGDPDAIQTIEVSGDVDQRDFAFLNKYFTDIDMRAANVVAYDVHPANTIPVEAFAYNDRLTRFVMPAGITYIGSNAFMETALTEVVIPKGVNTFGLNVFNACWKLKEVTVLNPEPAYINWCVFYGTLRDRGGTLHVPAGAKAAYEAADEWNLFSNIVEDAEDIYVGIGSVRDSAGTKGLFSLNGNTLTSATGKPLSAYDMAGRRVAQGATLTLKAGAYIIVCGNSSAKVLVK